MAADYTALTEELISALGELTEEDIAHIPLLDTATWNAEPTVQENRCYGYATNLMGNNNDQTGMLNTNVELDDETINRIIKQQPTVPKSEASNRKHKKLSELSNFATGNTWAAEGDGIIYSGFDFPLDFIKAKRGFPVAMFVKGKSMFSYELDYHLYTLRRNPDGTLVCTDKPGNIPVRIHQASDMFKDAKSIGYTHFAGYFNRPHSLALIQ